jgi:DNA invertase Pin-like site-specific DNA recombinase
MTTSKFIAYYRVSTDRQGKSGLGLEAQERAVMDFLNGGSWELVEAFTEIESGKRKDRPELAAALAACKRHKAKLIIAKLDRLSRNVAFVANLMDSGVDFTCVDMPEANRLTIHILAAVAEHEREMISKRTKEALQSAKERGVRLGNPTNLETARQHSRATRKALADQRAANVAPIIREIQNAGVKSLRAIANALNARGVKTSRGGIWQAESVRRVMGRAA